jgi:replication factor C subunit 2/4
MYKHKYTNEELKEKRDIIIKNLPWIEKYRPNKLENISLDPYIKNQILTMIKNRDIPHIILQGTPGVGKTSTIKCIARQMYGKYFKYMVLEMNASDDRGIQVQESIENFRKSYVSIREEDKNKIPKFKLVILDEADNMTDKAKHIISGFLEKNKNDIRFAFTCNHKNNILSSIQSRCYIIRYPRLTKDIVIKRLKRICKMECVYDESTDYDEEVKLEKGLKTIYEITRGDMRNALNILQLTNDRFGKITTENVYQIYDKPHPEKSKEIINSCYEDNIGEAFERIINMRELGYSGTDIALGLFTTLHMDICDYIPEKTKIKYLSNISYSLYNISKGLDSSLLQITRCIADMMS